MKKTIGTHTIGYPEKRNFVDLPFKKYQFQKVQNLHKIPAFLYHKSTKKTHQYYWNSFRDFDLHKVDLYHFFNTMSYGKKPWLCTFETSLPRWGGRNTAKGVKLIAGDPCRKIVALSHCAANIQRIFLRDNFPEYFDSINEKLIVLHPSQVCPPKEDIKKLTNSKLIFTLVGADFFRKGGKEILLAFDRIYKDGITDWQLNIVSKMDYGDYASKTELTDLKDAFKLIENYPNHIFHRYSLPNQEVLSLFRKTHIGLLPTYADTYGYSVLESQSYGCPVISTNIRALPEINNPELGWVIEMEKDELGNAILSSKESRLKFSNRLVEELQKTLMEIFKNPELIEIKGLKSYERLNYSVDSNTEFLENLYDEILS